MLYFGIAIFCTGIFIIQFILSFILGELDLDSDIDLDADGDVDFSLSDVLSFKGLCHFGIGFGWTMWFSKGENQFISACIAILVGIIFMFVLYGVYKLCLVFKNEGPKETDQNLIGRDAEIYSKVANDSWSVLVEYNKCLSKKTVKSLSKRNYSEAEKVKILKYDSGVLWIE